MEAFIELTHCDEDQATFYLEACQGQLEHAIARFFGELSGSGNMSNTRPSVSIPSLRVKSSGSNGVSTHEVISFTTVS